MNPFTWRKLGRVFTPQDVTGRPWLREFAQAPATLLFDDVVRVYFSCRPPPDASRQYVSYSAFVDLDRGDLRRIVRVAERPILSLGNTGEFDEFGTYPVSVIRAGGELRAYYAGWTRCESVPFNTAIGVAVSHDDGDTFEKLGTGPVLSCSLDEPFVLSGPKVRRFGGRWYLWYIAGRKWKRIEGRPEPVYKIRMAQSPDGLDWRRVDQDLIASRVEEDEAQASPDVHESGGRYHMFFAYRHSTGFRGAEFGYRIGYAWSDDLIAWHRDDARAGLHPSADGWDAQMVSYPHVFDVDGQTYMAYLGNEVGRFGFGLAVLEREKPLTRVPPVPPLPPSEAASAAPIMLPTHAAAPARAPSTAPSTSTAPPAPAASPSPAALAPATPTLASATATLASATSPASAARILFTPATPPPLRWRKLGRLFNPTRFRLPNGCVQFAQAPQALVFDDRVRIYFSTRAVDAVNGKFLSHVAFADFDAQLTTLLRVSEHTVIPLGKLGCFDEHGIFPMNVLRHEGRIYGYTCGWSRRVSVSVETSIGLAVSRDQGLTFERLGDGPVLTASLHEPSLVGDGFVKIVGGRFHMWYIFGTGWKPYAPGAAPDRTYKIGHATSADGIAWIKDEARQIIPDVLGPAEAQALPSVVTIDDRHHMFFCFRESFDFRTNRARAYRIGHAFSDDLLHWTRDDANPALEPGHGDAEGEGWDSDMLCYPHVFEHGGRVYLLYNGNEFGRFGFGAAVLER